MSWAAGAVIGTSLVGFYAEKLGIEKVWGLIAIFSLIGTIGMFILSKWKESAYESSENGDFTN